MTSTSSPTLPDDVLIDILAQVTEKKDLANCCLVSTQFSQIAKAQLYYQLMFSLSGTYDVPRDYSEEEAEAKAPEPQTYWDTLRIPNVIALRKGSKRVYKALEIGENLKLVKEVEVSVQMMVRSMAGCGRGEPQYRDPVKGCGDFFRIMEVIPSVQRLLVDLGGITLALPPNSKPPSFHLRELVLAGIVGPIASFFPFLASSSASSLTFLTLAADIDPTGFIEEDVRITFKDLDISYFSSLRKLKLDFKYNMRWDGKNILLKELAESLKRARIQDLDLQFTLKKNQNRYYRSGEPDNGPTCLEGGKELLASLPSSLLALRIGFPFGVDNLAQALQNKEWCPSLERMVLIGSAQEDGDWIKVEEACGGRRVNCTVDEAS